MPLATGLDAAAGSLLVGIVALLVLATLTALSPRSVLNPRGLSFALSAGACVGFLILGIAVIASGGSVAASAGQVLGFASVDVRYDALAGVFLVSLGIGGAASSVYGIGYAARADRPIDRTQAAYPIFLASLGLVFGAADAFAFLMAWELMALSSALLVVGRSPTMKVARAGYLYLVATHLATAAIVVAFAILTSAAGSTAFAAFGPAAAGLSPGSRDLVFVLLLVGFGTKAGAIPLHTWLPRAHPVAPSHISALMSAVMLKAGIYGIVRFGLDILGPGPEWWGLVVIVIGAVSAVLGILYALMEHDLKRLLAFSSIENIGIILIAVGVALLATAAGLTALAGLALSAALFHTINHAVFKSLLFLGAGSIQSAAGTRDLNALGGLARAMPVTALAFAVGAAAISGLPPLNGFASELADLRRPARRGQRADLIAPRPFRRPACHRRPRTHRRAGGGLLREGGRDRPSRPSAQSRRGRRSRDGTKHAPDPGGPCPRLRRPRVGSRAGGRGHRRGRGPDHRWGRRSDGPGVSDPPGA